MSGRTLLAGALGGLVLFIWLSISWMALPFHGESLNGIRHDAQLDALLIQMGAKDGLNYYPSYEGMDQQEYAELARSVPNIGIMSFHPDGFDMANPMAYIRGLLGCIIAGILVAIFLSVLPAGSGLPGRVLFCTLFGAAAFFCTQWVDGGFYHFPMRHTMLQLMDGLISWTLAGVVMALVMRSPDKAGKPGPESTS